jgi:molybdopterin converting factor small subunit
MPTIRVKFSGAFADAAHKRETTYQISSFLLGGLIEHLLENNDDKFRLLMIDPATGDVRRGVTILVNGQRLSLKDQIAEGDEVTLLTPVAGG